MNKSMFVLVVGLLAAVQPASGLSVDHSVSIQSHLEQTEQDKTPFAAGCFMWLMTAFALIGVVMYTWNTFNKKLETMPGMNEKRHEFLSKVFAEESLQSALDALSIVPVVCLLILFVAMRSRTELVDEQGHAYTVAEFGMGTATVGLLLLALDTMSVRIESLVFGNVSIPLGNGLILVGYVVLLMACFTTKSDAYEWTTASSCFVALAFLHVGLAFEAKLVSAMEMIAPDVHAWTSTVVNAQLVQQVRNAAGFAPMAMTVLFYFHFYPWASKHEHPDIANDLALCLTIGIFVNAFAVTLSVFGSDMISGAAKGAKLAATVLVYATFFGLMYCLIVADSPSVATCNLEVLLLVVSSLNLVKVAIQEGVSKLQDTEQEEGMWKRALNLISDMRNSASSVQLICVLFLFVHFRAELLLGVNVKDHIDGFSYLSPAIYLTTSAVFIQMLSFVVGVFSDSGVDGYINAAGVGLTNLGILLVVLAMVA